MWTNTLPSAGTQAQVTITVYGHKGNSGAITLGHGDGRNFQPGNIDEFEVIFSVLLVCKWMCACLHVCVWIVQLCVLCMHIFMEDHA